MLWFFLCRLVIPFYRGLTKFNHTMRKTVNKVLVIQQLKEQIRTLSSQKGTMSPTYFQFKKSKLRRMLYLEVLIPKNIRDN